MDLVKYLILVKISLLTKLIISITVMAFDLVNPSLKLADFTESKFDCNTSLQTSRLKYGADGGAKNENMRAIFPRR